MENQTNINTHSCDKKCQVLFPTGFLFRVVVTLDYGVCMDLEQISLTYQLCMMDISLVPRSISSFCAWEKVSGHETRSACHRIFV